MFNYNNRNYNKQHRRYDNVNQQHRYNYYDRYKYDRRNQNYEHYSNNIQNQQYYNQYYQQNHYNSEQQGQEEIFRNQQKSYNQYNEYQQDQGYNEYYDDQQEQEQEEQQHEQQQEQQQQYASRDKTRNIRDMNNWCKYVNITHSIRESYKENKDSKINILDLGCGKGADLYKCRGNKKYIKKFLGIDIESEFVMSARRKYCQILQTNIKYKNASYEMRKKFGLNNAYGQTASEFFDEPIFDAQFVCDDMNSSNLKNHPLILNNKPFHLINIQFSLHYSFINKKSFISLLQTFNQSTDIGSYFICSFVRDDIIIKRLEKQNGNNHDIKNIIYKNQFQSIKMKKSHYKFIKKMYEKYDLLGFDPNTIYQDDKKENKDNNNNNDNNNDFCDELIGIPYKYHQMDCVEGCDGTGCQEYFVPFIVLCKLLWKYCKMRLIYKKTCGDIYIESSRKYPYKHGYSKGRGLDTVKWTTDEQQVIDTYSYALFQRV